MSKNWSWRGEKPAVKVSTVGELLKFIENVDPDVRLQNNDDGEPCGVCVMVGDQDPKERYLSITEWWD